MFNKKTIITSGLVITFALGTLLHPSFGAAQSINELRSRSAKLQQQIDANNKHAEHLEHQGNTLKSAIESLDLQIEQASAQIQLTDNKIVQLTHELKEAEAELERQKQLLKANVRALYKRGDASTVEMIVGSDNFSQYIDEQEYLERLKSGIQESTAKVLELTQKIEVQKKEQEALKKQQVAAKQTLANTRTQRARLLSETQGQEAAYRGVVANLKKQREQAEAALVRAMNSGSYRLAAAGPVGAGQVVGAIGNTGFSSGSHLHLEARMGRSIVNPKPYIRSSPVKMPPAWISQGYGEANPWYGSGYHGGIDYAGPSGSAIYAIDSGNMYRGCSANLFGTNAYGYVAIVEHSNGVKSIYAHMSGGPPSCNYNTFY